LGWTRRWAQYVRQRDTKTLLFVQVSSQEEAKVAVHDLNADVVVAQGHESGGHGHSQALPVRQLTCQVLSVAGEKTPSPCVLAAGGLVDGNHVAEMLDLGASGAVLGTRFLLSPESLYTDAQRAALIDAKGSPTVRTMAFDEARGTLGWPAGVDGRGLKNGIVAF
jgi:nitronate monooxygenase